LVEYVAQILRPPCRGIPYVLSDIWVEILQPGRFG
jgi:hypothetical protein